MLSFIDRLDPSLATFIVIVSVILYGTVTLLVLRKKPGKLWIPALALLIVSTVFYFWVYDYAAAKAWFPKLVMSVISAMDLFLFRMASSIGNLIGFFFMKDGAVQEGVRNPQAHLILLQGLYICSIWTTSILVVHFLAGRLISRAWLSFHSGQASDGVRTHVFLGTGRFSTALAKTLPAGDRIIFVETPDREAMPDKVSFLGLFRGVRSGSSSVERLRKAVPGAVLLKARQSVAKCTEGPFFEELGLKGLGRWCDYPGNCIYLLSDDTEENMLALRRMVPVKAQVYYHAKREGLALKTDLASPQNIHIVDSSFLATKALKSDAGLYPINLVEIARNAEGEPAGYVCSPFRSMVCGFGESGRGALSFLYEFGAFCGRDGKPSPFHCEVIDPDMDRLLPGYMAAHPALDAGRVSFLRCSTESESFRELVRQRIDTLNYVFVSMGDDGNNVNLAVEILQAAFKCHRRLDDLLIVVKLDKPDEHSHIISFFNDNYGGRETIRTIGDLERTWTWENISEEGYLRHARRFHAAYAVSSGDDVPWNRRKELINCKPGTELAHRMELRRKTEQDFANCFHVTVKAALCPSRFWENPDTAGCIPFRFDGKHYTGNDPETGRILEYLAILEHLRWMASHEMAGYRYGEEKCEDLMTHPDMRPYGQLDGATQHYDWIVVKTTLNVLSGSAPQA